MVMLAPPPKIPRPLRTRVSSPTSHPHSRSDRCPSHFAGSPTTTASTGMPATTSPIRNLARCWDEFDTCGVNSCESTCYRSGSLAVASASATGGHPGCMQLAGGRQLDDAAARMPPLSPAAGVWNRHGALPITGLRRRPPPAPPPPRPPPLDRGVSWQEEVAPQRLPACTWKRARGQRQQ